MQTTVLPALFTAIMFRSNCSSSIEDLLAYFKFWPCSRCPACSSSPWLGKLIFHSLQIVAFFISLLSSLCKLFLICFPLAHCWRFLWMSRFFAVIILKMVIWTLIVTVRLLIVPENWLTGWDAAASSLVSKVPLLSWLHPALVARGR